LLVVLPGVSKREEVLEVVIVPLRKKSKTTQTHLTNQGAARVVRQMLTEFMPRKSQLSRLSEARGEGISKHREMEPITLVIDMAPLGSINTKLLQCEEEAEEGELRFILFLIQIRISIRHLVRV
jgi:hypothetical protein